MVAAMGELRRARLIAQRSVILRASLELAVAICFIVALGHLTLAAITAMDNRRRCCGRLRGD